MPHAAELFALPQRERRLEREPARPELQRGARASQKPDYVQPLPLQ
jgi:hypothetical protein